MGSLEQALVFIASAIILVPIFQKLRFGSVLGYLIAGVVVGPYGLGLIPDSESIMHFAELGVVFLLFVIGLEIQPSKLWSMRHHLLGLGGLQIVLSTTVFAALGLYFGLDTTAALMIGFALSLSSTAYALQTLVERNEFGTEFGRASFSVLLMQDLVAIPALAFIPLFSRTESHAHGFDLKHAAVSAGLIVALLVASRFLIRPIFRIIAATRTREIFTATTLFIVLGVAVLMQKIGLSAALGTFVAGVLLADSEYRHEIETNLEPFKSLLMGLFFISVGMGVSLDMIAWRPGTVVGLTLLYLVAKFSVLYVSGRIFKLNHEKSKRMALTIAQGGEFAFVIFGILLQTRIAPTESLEILTVVITLSMALSPLVSLANEYLEARAFKAKPYAAPEYDTISDEAPRVIVAGYGRFGQVFGRILRAQEIPFVAIDHDPQHIELVRRFGSKVYYGDASRVDLLESAGAARAEYFILAIDDVEVSIKTATTVKEHFPNLTIFARARNRGHVFDLMDAGVGHIKRETFDSSILFVKDLLQTMGFEAARAAAIVERFRRHDEISMIEQHKVRNDQKQYMSLAMQSTAQLAQVLSDDSLKSYVGSEDAPQAENPRTSN
ncbi:MAG: monovalent cation:proton antiporter-2 (CPA2) family protein [Bdellovibrionota bacterium]